jgi:hypothetical protein
MRVRNRSATQNMVTFVCRFKIFLTARSCSPVSRANALFEPDQFLSINAARSSVRTHSVIRLLRNRQSAMYMDGCIYTL